MKPSFKDVNFNILRYMLVSVLFRRLFSIEPPPTMPPSCLPSLPSIFRIFLKTHNFGKGVDWFEWGDVRCVGEIACVGRLMAPTVITAKLLSRPEIPSLMYTAPRKFVQCSSIGIEYVGKGG